MARRATGVGRGVGSQGTIGNVFMTMLLVVIALSLTGTIQSAVDTAVASGVGMGNLTGAAATLARLVPLFWVIMTLGIGVSAIYIFLKQ